MLWECLECTAPYAPGLARCPQCGSTDWVEQGSEEHEMPKISRAGGATIAGVPGLDNQSDREEDRHELDDPDRVGGVPDRATRIEQAGQPDPDREDGTDQGDQRGDQEERRDPQEGDQGDDFSRDYSDWTYTELQAEARERGLNATGSRETVVGRLAKHDREQQDSGG